ncbi:DUF4329 domain-containing protein [Pseudomonas sp. CCC3.1]|uniref:DUF4329 domain-containing protein n=1 Tax=Pseudomonas sp. CCC3.1 TaxID=3048607 RepID=UPI002AC8F3CD|nr:DUF4329 domain-containing protein [Pseudomonas sp. CCC3.1]MEB0204725.1 DUF4329 domain-containing protein [Pseudomonas sp. CCC3.1]WPX38934.1 DUF4329 domain-containing protein [Pseudomonas sp. CCC3.1]
MNNRADPSEAQALSRPSPALSPAFITSDDAAVYAHDLIGSRRNKEYGGFILSKDHHYYATLPVSSGGSLFRPSDVLARSPEGDMLPPEGYVIEGLYHSHTAFKRTTLVGDPESDLQDNFFSLMDLRTAITFRHNYARFYLSNPDKSLICYVASGSPAEQALEPLLMLVHPGTPDHLEQSFAPSIFLPSHLLSMVYGAGELTIIQSGTFWGRRGRIGSGWREWQAEIFREARVPPICGPVLLSADDAALFAHKEIGQRPYVQQAGFILKHLQADLYICTKPQPTVYLTFDRPDVFPRNSTGLPQLPEGYRMFAVYHSADSHRAAALGAPFRVLKDFMSPDNVWIDYLMMQASPGSRAYFSAPEGALLSYVRFSLDAETELIASVAHPNELTSQLDRQLTAGSLTATEFVRRVAAAFVLNVVKTDEVWTQTGRVSDDWGPFAPVPT